MKKIFLCDGPLKNNLVISCDTNKKIALSINKSIFPNAKVEVKK